MTPTPLKRAAAALAASLLLTAAPAARAELNKGDRFEDWTVNCEAPKPPATKQRCFILQNILVKDSRQPILLIAVGLLGDNRRPAAVLTVPLGVFLPAGLTLTVPDAAPVLMVFETCTPKGCRAALALAGDVLAGMRKGGKAQITLMDGRRRQINLPVSLKGFDAGFSAVEKQ
jgi:invasion protein IalB